jgi:hypothetical protein
MSRAALVSLVTMVAASGFVQGCSSDGKPAASSTGGANATGGSESTEGGTPSTDAGGSTGTTASGGRDDTAGATETGGQRPSSSTAGSAGAPDTPPPRGICQATCNKDCTSDQDCDMTSGQMCCDFGEAGKACVAATQCPTMCQDDDRCNTAQGLACVLQDIAAEYKVCAAPGTGVKTCTADDECASGDVCCKNYDQPFCTTPSKCAKACSKSTDCETELRGETCCTTLKAVEPHLAVSGLCINTEYTTCPQPCAQSSDCGGSTPLCCDGMCAAACKTEYCNKSSDCTGQICCKSALTRLPGKTQTFSQGPHCSGTPSYSACPTSVTSASSCTNIQGCRAGDVTGTCTGTADACSYNASSTTCAAQPGCTWSDAGGCYGTSYTCSNHTSSTSCEAQTGCTWTVSTPARCSGTALSCSTTSESTCTNRSGCTWTPSTTSSCAGTPYYADCSDWSGVSSYSSYCTGAGCEWDSSSYDCTGTVKACSANTTSTACSADYGCQWTSGTGSCSGTPTPCTDITGSTSCEAAGCSWYAEAGACSGTPASCGSNESSTTCLSANGCSWTTSAVCLGTPTPCSDSKSSSTCDSTYGCYWSTNAIPCTGTPTACALMSLETCTEQSGCDVVTN